MKIPTLFLAVLFLAVNIYGQSAITLTTTPANINGIRALIDHPDLNGNAEAIIIVRPPVGYSHPLAVWYLANKWYVFNTDQANMSPREQFQLLYWSEAEPSHFAHVVTPQNLRGNRSYIDNAALNNKPTASIDIFQTMSNARGGYWNANEPTLEYDQAEKKWYVVNKNGQAVLAGNAYNIAIDQQLLGVVTTTPPVQGTILPDMRPKGAAGGDLTGNYPDPLVKGIRGREVSAGQPAVGDTLRWNGNEWAPAPVLSGGGGQAGQILTSTGPGSAPLWKSLGGVQTLYKNFNTAISTSVAVGTSADATLMGHSFNLDKPARVIINVRMLVQKPLGSGPTNADGSLEIKIDGNLVESSVTTYYVDYFTSAAISNYVVDLSAGGHTVGFVVRHLAGPAFNFKPQQSSVIIIPVSQ